MRRSNDRAQSESGATVKDRARRRRWLLAIAVLLSLGIFAAAPVSVLFAIRQLGFRRLHALQDEIASRGDWATLEDFIEGVEIDPDLQEAFWDWSIESYTGSLIEIPDDDFQGWIGSRPGTPVPESVSEVRRIHDEAMSRGLTLLRQPGLMLSSHGWAGLDLTADSPLIDTARVRAPSFLGLREMTAWLSVRALVSDSAGLWLSEIDRLIDASVPSGSLTDALFLSVLCDDRDEAYFACLVQGNVNDGILSAWLKESLQHLGVCPTRCEAREFCTSPRRPKET